MDPAIRALYVVTAYNRHPDDVITPWLVRTIDLLRQRGIDVEVLAPSYRGLGDAVIEGVRVHRFRYAPRRWEDLTHDQTAPDRIRNRPAYLALVPGYVAGGSIAAYQLGRSGRFDLVHVHWPLPHALFGLAARRAGEIPLVCSFHGVELTWAREWPIFRPFLRWVLGRTDAVTSNSTYTRGLIQALHDREVRVIPFGATVDMVESQAVKRSTSGVFKLLFVGRLVERKGVAYLLEAVARLSRTHDIRLEVVGDGPLRPALEERAARLGIADRVWFRGFLGSDELGGRYARCDTFVLPAVYDSKGDTEGLGVVLVEALSYGKPAIASAAGGIPDLIRDGVTGQLVPPGDVDALVEALRRYIENPELARRHAEAGRKHVRQEFSWEVIIDDLVSLYTGLVERAGRGGDRVEEGGAPEVAGSAE